jgi:hypothetical protein
MGIVWRWQPGSRPISWFRQGETEMPIDPRDVVARAYLTQRIEVLKSAGESDGAGGTRKLADVVVAELAGRETRGQMPPVVPVEGQKVTTITSWDIRLSLTDYEALQARPGQCFKIAKGDRLRGRLSRFIYEVLGTDEGRTDATYLTATCKRIGS